MLKPIPFIRWLPLSIFLGVITILFFRSTSSSYPPQDDLTAAQKAQEWIKGPLQAMVPPVTATATVTATAVVAPKTKPSYLPGVTDPHKDYKKALIVASIKKENTSWVAEHLPDVDAYIYVVDDPDAKLTVPKNKNNEVMPYLTFIIDHYDDLPEIMIFVHAHQRTHHNPPLMPFTYDLVKELNPQRVMREGYMNLNCGNWDSGKCTAEMRPAEGAPFGYLQDAWRKLFPEYPLPQILGQFCCAQFAVSRDRVRQIPLATFQRWRQTVLDMEIPSIGYFFEFLWQFIFKGEHVYCPSSWQCYCDGFGVCFGGRDAWSAYNRLLTGKERLVAEVDEINRRHLLEQEASGDDDWQPPEADLVRIANMRKVIDDHVRQMVEMGKVARARGKDPKIRAAELGRKWKEGDGYV